MVRIALCGQAACQLKSTFPDPYGVRPLRTVLKELSEALIVALLAGLMFKESSQSPSKCVRTSSL